MKNSLTKMSLHKQVQYFLQFRGYEIHEQVILQGKFNQEYNFNYVFWVENSSNENSCIGVIIKDWKRSCGFDIILQAERILNEVTGITRIMVIAHRFSGAAQTLADRIGIITLTSGELVSIFRTYKINPEVIEP
ncbi:MAG: hypothetical protein ACFE95_00175 [Candidatus Hodarchaeota archaeon]